MIDPGLPRWARELATLLPTCPNFLLTGNIHDQHFVTRPAPNGASEPARLLRSVPALVAEALIDHGYTRVLSFRADKGAATLAAAPDSAADEELVGARLSEFATDDPLDGLATLIERTAESEHRVALVLPFASRLVREPTRLSDAEYAFFRRADIVCRTARPLSVGAGPSLFNPVIWILDSDRDVPSWFTARNEFLRSISIPLPHTGERRELGARLVPTLTGGSETSVAEGVRVLSEQMAGMPLTALQKAVQIARDQGMPPDRIEDAARSYRVGVTDNPWKSDHLTDRLLRELGVPPKATKSRQPLIGERVLGQELAIRKALDILVRSSVGLTAAQAGPNATRPRGVLFFAGPTGVGKTELAKALTKLLFDDERFYVRFDMSEFSAEQAADRLIGAPPGYVGFDAGGELTNAMRERPFSLVLFDEIEKAHPRILDKFLQILDDGRLTDGRGDTVFFTEAVVVFTSNLGIYEPVTEEGPDGLQRQVRRLAIDRASMSYPEMSAAVTRSITNYFTLELGRPELLNRIGDNIVVFDFVAADVGEQILSLMLRNVAARVLQEHAVDLEIPDEAKAMLAAKCLEPEVLALGGRGIGAKLETAFINPLARELFLTRPAAGTRKKVTIRSGADGYHVGLTS